MRRQVNLVILTFKSSTLSQGKYILSIDQGTTSSRAIVFDYQGQVVASAQQEFTQFFPQPGWVEHDANEIWNTQLNVIEAVLQKANINASDIASIGITNQRETSVIWNKETGEPIHRAIVWQDNRTASICQQLKENNYTDLVQSKTGLFIDSYFSATKIQWLLDHIPNARNQAEQGQLLFGTIDSWLLWKLTNGKVHATDSSNASRTMLYNIHEEQWDDTLLELFTIPKNILPEVRNSNDHFGNFQLGHHAIPIHGIAGDQQAALFGQFCFDPGMAKNTYGTGCFMLLNTGHEAYRSSNGLLTTIAWRLDGKTTYALEGSVFIAGAAIQWLRDALEFFSEAEESEALATSIDDSDHVVVVPTFSGLGAPHWNMKTKGGMFGLTRGTTKAHITRATLESLAYQTKDVLDAMIKDTGLNLQHLKVDGGATTNNFLMQFQSDLLQVVVHRPKMIESTAFGAALLAGLGVGFWNTNDIELFKSANQTIFTPSDHSTKFQKLYANWLKALQAIQIYES